MVCTEFSGKKQNATVWLDIFQKEATRLTLPEYRFLEALRLFLEGPASDWHKICYRTVGLEGTWESWKTSFLENFDNKGWSEIVCAYSFSYLAGSFTDYDLKNIKLLLNVEPSLPEIVRINLVVVGLPANVRDRLDRSDIKNHGDLMAALGVLESMKAWYFLIKKKNKQTGR